ncbi:hypothetical protein [Microcystis aeruginosa]|uniref:hypothetical protein n=1 Tax=Microcystis aeruginosa TaxID=1126 RepID=UPI00187ED25A|nr:hypothetical protein [Microcystis aeruginosa]MBE8993061.1 hypothetical protein [Microcystis aeruginosa LEGE 91341]
MKINFFDKKCQSQTHRHEFGICDPPFPPETPAYLDTENPSDWIAIVENSQEIEVTFTAIDKCIEIRKVDGNGMDKRCDGMLTYVNCLIFVELKERKGKNSGWVGDGEEQLRNTIRVFIENHGIEYYSSRKAYIANNKKPTFQTSQTERMEKFRQETGFRLIIQNIVKID